MKTAHDTLPMAYFEVPDGIEFVNICLESGKLATDRCVEISKEIFRTENVPQETCPIHPSKGLYISPKTDKDKFTAPEDSSDVYHF
jgi:membrane carboxypeptidase/penicillin-binding protein